jgi:hypothetical protein
MFWQVILQYLITPLIIRDTDFAELMCRPFFEADDFISSTTPQFLTAKLRTIHPIWEPRFLLPWPIWSRKRNGSKIHCVADNDCVFPQTCCVDPILPGEKFCCTGFGRRRLIPAYAFLAITSTRYDDDHDDDAL